MIFSIIFLPKYKTFHMFEACMSKLESKYIDRYVKEEHFENAFF